MPVELKCASCGNTDSFDEAEVKSGKAECPKCGSTVRAPSGDDLSGTMNFDSSDMED